jgi:lipopolysaccharide/colanic/teichoic acid biosynthesis glycosyltransferase
LTGFAQINGRGLLKFGETIQWDVRYVRARNAWLDLKTFLRAIKSVITRRGEF